MTNLYSIGNGVAARALTILLSGSLADTVMQPSPRPATPKRDPKVSAQRIEAARARRKLRARWRRLAYATCLAEDPIDRSRQGIPSGAREQ